MLNFIAIYIIACHNVWQVGEPISKNRTVLTHIKDNGEGMTNFIK